jgi:hypothetical protein
MGCFRAPLSVGKGSPLRSIKIGSPSIRIRSGSSVSSISTFALEGIKEL